MKHPLQPASHSGAVSRRTRRADGVDVDRSLLLDAVRALRTATTPTAPVRGRVATARGPRGCSRRPGARRRRRRIGWRPPRRPAPQRPLSGAVLEVSPVAPRDRPRLARKRLKVEKETTHRHDSRKRVASTPRNRRHAPGRRATTAPRLPRPSTTPCSASSCRAWLSRASRSEPPRRQSMPASTGAG